MKKIFALFIVCFLLVTLNAQAYDTVRLGPEYMPDSSASRALGSADIYVGLPDLDPEVVGNQRQLYVQQEDGSIVAVSQPISTSAGGIPLYLGSPVTLLVDGPYSLKVLNSYGSQIYYVPDTGIEPVVPQSNYCYPDSTAADQGLTGDDDTIKYCVDSIGSDISTIFLGHDSGNATSPYVLSTNETIPANISVIIENGAILTPDVGVNYTFTSGPQSQIVALPGQQIIDSSSTGIVFTEGGGELPIGWWGAVGDGSTNDTTAIQSALTVASVNASTVIANDGTYSVTSIRVYNGTVGFISRGGIIKGRGVSTDKDGGNPGIVQLDGPEMYSGIAVDGCTISLVVDMAEGDYTGIFIDGATNCLFEKNYVYNIADDAAPHHGMQFWWNSSFNRIVNNLVIQAETPTDTQLGITMFGETLDYANYFAGGTITDSTSPPTGNIISGNTIIFGRVAIDLLGAEGNLVSNNVCYKQVTRAIFLANASNNNTISNNQIYGFGASAVHLAYGPHHNLIEGNTCKQIAGYNGVSGEGAIQAYVGCKYNKIVNNYIDTFTNYGVYLAVDAIGNTVEGNTVVNYYLAGIAIENDWLNTPPTEALYSRPNYGAPPVGADWSFNDSTDNVIKGNIIEDCYATRVVTGVYLAQIDAPGATGLTNNVIDDNTVKQADDLAYSFYFFVDTLAKFTGLELTNNIAPSNINVRFDTDGGGTTPWDPHIAFINGNSEIIEAPIMGEPQLMIDDATPSVNSKAPRRDFWRLANTGANVITDFDDGYEDQEFTLRLDTHVTITHNIALIYLKGEVNIAGVTANLMVGFREVDGVWRETWRNF